MKRIFKVFGIVAVISTFFSCQLFGAVQDSLKKTPYQIKGEMVMEDSDIYKNAGFEFSFNNLSEKTVSGFTVVFFLFDEEGEPPSGARSNIVLSITARVNGNESIEDCVNLDKYIYVVPEVPFTVDYLYVSKIIYEDGSIWSDPLGFSVMK